MKKLQNNFTTPEQSKRLLELGVPADSSDCYLLRTRTKGDTFIVEVLHDELYSEKYKFTNMLEYLPCWSVGRISEILYLCDKKKVPIKFYDLYPLKDGVSPVEQMIDILEYAIKMNDIDFSKLED